jgi:fumarylpyruvate hydrolase
VIDEGMTHGETAALAIEAPLPALIPVAGTDRYFPVRRIWCVGRNFADHAREMGADPGREPPFFFAKPADAIVPGGGEIPYPAATSDLQHEVELAVAIGQGGKDIAIGDAAAHIFGYAVALDMTRRDLQAEAKRLSRPWDMAKGFDQSCPISPIRKAAATETLDAASLWITVNGERRQQGIIADMIWSVPECIACLSSLVALQPGDLLLTGTPAGVSTVVPGDRLHAHCDGVGDLLVEYVPAAPSSCGGEDLSHG